MNQPTTEAESRSLQRWFLMLTAGTVLLVFATYTAVTLWPRSEEALAPETEGIALSPAPGETSGSGEVRLREPQRLPSISLECTLPDTPVINANLQSVEEIDGVQNRLESGVVPVSGTAGRQPQAAWFAGGIEPVPQVDSQAGGPILPRQNR